MSAPEVAGAVAPFLADPGGSVLLFDFDGTLSPTVPRPDDARALPGAVDRLRELADRYATVAVVSGRPVSFLRGVLPDSLLMSGQYGLEQLTGGVHRERPDVGPWRDQVAAAAARAVEAGIEGLRVEPKGLSLTLHWREHPEAEGPVTGLVERLAAETGLVARPAKKSVELHPPLESDKGVVVRALASGARQVLYVGDDLGDLPALRAVAELRSGGAGGLAVAVDGPELPADLAAEADLLVDGPDGVIGLLDALLG